MVKIVSTEKDHSISHLVDELHKLEIPSEVNYYSNIEYSTFRLSKEDFLILRDPYNTGFDYSDKLRFLLNNFKSQVLFDSIYMINYPEYEDKLCQMEIFKKSGLKIPDIQRTYTGTPLIAKKRISSRNKGNYIIRSKDEFDNFFKINNIDDFILQKLINLIHDYRLLFYKRRFIGALEREVKLSSKINNKFTIRGLNSMHIDHKELPLDDCLKFIDFTKADFLGIDIIQDNESFYFIEANISPQFASFSKNTGINVAKIIAEDIATNI